MSKTSKPLTKEEQKALNKKKKTMWKRFALGFLGADLFVGLITVIVLLVSNYLPGHYVAAFAAILLLLFMMGFVLMVMTRKRKGQPKRTVYIKRGLGTTITSLSMILCFMIIFAFAKLNVTIDGITQEQTVITDVVAVYVLQDDPAQNLNDAADYSFCLTTAFDYINVQKAVSGMEDTLGSSLNVTTFDSVTESVDSLLNGTCQAMVLPESYEEIVSEMEGYESFTEQTRILYEYTVETIVEDGAEDASNVDVTQDVFCVYLSGSDTRNSKLATSRSDVNILAFVNPQTKQVLLLSTPRDYYVPISISANGTCDKLTHCGLYGIDCSEDTLENLYGCEVNYYAQINFNGFETLVDAIGGINVYSEKSFTTTHGGDAIQEGDNYMTGKVALGFVRERYAFSDGDLARSRNQMRVISAIVSKVSSGRTLIMNYGEIMDSMQGMFATDMSNEDIQALAQMQLSDMSSWDVRSYYVTGGNASKTTYSIPNKEAYVMTPDQTKIDFAKGLIQKIESGQVLTDADFVEE